MASRLTKVCTAPDRLKPEHQRPERLPEHEEALAKAPPDVVEHGDRNTIVEERTNRAIAADASLIFSADSSPPAFTAFSDAVLQVVVEQQQGHRLQSLRHRRDLFEHVDAVPVLVDHPLEAADLAFNFAEPLEHRILIVAASRPHTSSPIPPTCSEYK